MFGIPCAISRVLRKRMLLEPEKVKLGVMTIVYLHIFFIRNKESRKIYTPPGTFDCEWMVWQSMAIGDNKEVMKLLR